MEGIITGIVKNNWDTDFPGKLKVEYTLGETGKMTTGWVPVMTAYAGPGYGSYQLPEIGTEVVIGFNSGDNCRPIVLGCLWNKINTPPEKTSDEDNTVKLWKSKGGYRLSVDEKNKIAAFTDPDGENTMSLASQDGQLTWNIKTKVILQIAGEDFLTIEKGSITVNGAVTVRAESIALETEKAVAFNAESITAEIKKNITINAGEEVTLKSGKALTMKGKTISLAPEDTAEIAGKNVEVKPTQGYELKTKTFKVNGTSLEMKASASGKLEAGGMMSIKGKMLKLN